MASRKKLRHDDYTRDKIQVTQLINRLTKFINGEIDLNSTQVNAIRILLGKKLPDLQAVEANVESTQKVVSSDALSEDEWASQYGQSLAVKKNQEDEEADNEGLTH